MKNSAKVKLAQADFSKAQAALSESKDAFVPAVSTTGGVGKGTGAPLSPPVIFSIAAQSLVFNSSQADYIRAARASIDSAQLALDATRSDVVEDTTTTYVTLDNALQRSAVQSDALGFAHHLEMIAEDRFTAGVDPHVELIRARRTEAEIRLQQLLIEDEVTTQSEHLARLTGLPPRGLRTVHDSVPVLRPALNTADDQTLDPNRMVGISAAFAAARAKQFIAHGDKRYLLRPQVAFSAEYSRISTAFNTYTQYYPSFGARGNSFNSLSLGVGITLPILDMVHRAKARESAADAVRSLLEAQIQQSQFFEARSKLRHSATELSARKDLAQLDRELAQDQLEAVLVRLQPTAGAAQGAEQLTPKDEANARLQERQRMLDILNAELQLQTTEVMLMRQEGSLSGWLAATIPAAANAPSISQPEARPPLPATLGTEPNGTSPTGTAPSAVPTTGTVPSNLPSSPVTNPAPTNPPAAPSTTPSGPPHP